MNVETARKRTTVYIQKDIMKAMKKICLREGISLSRKTERLYARIVSAHLPGNPQLPLETFGVIKSGECYRCEKILQEHKLKQVLFISGLKVNMCKPCIESEQVKGTFCTIKKVY